jgi:hypothetical protein
VKRKEKKVKRIIEMDGCNKAYDGTKPLLLFTPTFFKRTAGRMIAP